jgi:hypothetical protein
LLADDFFFDPDGVNGSFWFTGDDCKAMLDADVLRFLRLAGVRSYKKW